MILRGANYAEKQIESINLLQVATDTRSVSLVRAIFQAEVHVLSKAGEAHTEVLDTFFKLLISSCRGEAKGWAMDMDRDGVATEAEFALGLVELLLASGHAPLQGLCGTVSSSTISALLKGAESAERSLDLNWAGPTDGGNTILHVAAESGDSVVVSSVVQATGICPGGLEIEKQNLAGETALELAVAGGHIGAIERPRP